MANPENAATDPNAAAKQDQIKRDHDKLEESARRVESSVSNTDRGAVTDPDAAAKQDRVKEDHDRLQESARRVEASVPSDIRNTPIERSDEARDRDGDPNRDRNHR